MRLAEGGSTSPTLLRAVADWQNHPAWVRFQGRYDPLMRRWCRGYGLDDDSVDEVCQRIWIELANRMRAFQYDPGGTFRGWLRRLARHGSWISCGKGTAGRSDSASTIVRE